jgi:hypothetical protein
MIRGTTSAALDLVDVGGGANAKWMQLASSDNTTRFQSVTDAGSVQASNILVMNNLSGNIGIGTTQTGNGVLTINGTSSSNMLRLENDGLGNESTIRFRSKSSGGANLHADISLYATGSEQGFLGFKVPYNNSVNSGYDLVIDNAGNVGIGTTNPNIGAYAGASLEVLGSTTAISSIQVGSRKADADASAYGDFAIVHGNTTASEKRLGIIRGLADGSTANNRGGKLQFFTKKNNSVNFNLAMIIDSDGNVGIGTTSASYKLDINGTLRATSVTESSDRRLKENIAPLATNDLRLVTGFQYNLTSDGSFHYGVIAQEVEKIFPHMVSTDEQGMKSVAYNEFIPLLIEGYKEQDEEIKGLRKELAELKQLLLNYAKNER